MQFIDDDPPRRGFLRLELGDSDMRQSFFVEVDQAGALHAALTAVLASTSPDPVTAPAPARPEPAARTGDDDHPRPANEPGS
ncbi:hypothetical protein ACN27G_29330 [Plantactinospora sp. WMMB334]|uniref:hypothetical protein n=1 Tax=Plantactinospora sp. WMMB334 TaxID=3404119 RepID=UPI003B957554